MGGGQLIAKGGAETEEEVQWVKQGEAEILEHLLQRFMLELELSSARHQNSAPWWLAEVHTLNPTPSMLADGTVDYDKGGGYIMIDS